MRIDPCLVTVEAELHPESAPLLLAALPAFLAATRAEAGCLAYEFYHAHGAPERIATIERWSSALAAEAHMQAGHTRAFMAVAERCLRAPPRVTWLPL